MYLIIVFLKGKWEKWTPSAFFREKKKKKKKINYLDNDDTLPYLTVGECNYIFWGRVVFSKIATMVGSKWNDGGGCLR